MCQRIEASLVFIFVARHGVFKIYRQIGGERIPFQVCETSFVSGLSLRMPSAGTGTAMPSTDNAG